jgi:hypothetical protein
MGWIIGLILVEVLTKQWMWTRLRGAATKTPKYVRGGPERRVSSV